MSRAITISKGGTSPQNDRRSTSKDMGFLCFHLGQEEYGVDLNLIKQIVKPPPLTWVPRVMENVLGIISIRGNVVTLLDTRLLMGMEATSWPRTGRILLVDIFNERIGLLVDDVTLVRRVGVDSFEEDPVLGDGIATDHVIGIVRPDEECQVTVIDIEQMLVEALR